MFGSYEGRISEIYRAIYLDVDALVVLTRHWKPVARRILEVGCGEGAVTERLNRAFPEADITAIDISSRIGRLYKGSLCRVRFVRCDAQQIAQREPEQYDLVVLSDVLHHVPSDLRLGLLESIRTVLAPNGTFVFKDWQRSHTPIHWLCYASDRWLTGDRISYMTRMEMRNLLALTFGANALIEEARIRPWSNNIATLVRVPIMGRP